MRLGVYVGRALLVFFMTKRRHRIFKHEREKSGKNRVKLPSALHNCYLKWSVDDVQILRVSFLDGNVSDYSEFTICTNRVDS